jgi:hypothetical protein
MALRERYRDRHGGWNVRHFFGHYPSEGGQRSYGYMNVMSALGKVETSAWMECGGFDGADCE